MSRPVLKGYRAGMMAERAKVAKRPITAADLVAMSDEEFARFARDHVPPSDRVSVARAATAH